MGIARDHFLAVGHFLRILGRRLHRLDYLVFGPRDIPLLLLAVDDSHVVSEAVPLDDLFEDLVSVGLLPAGFLLVEEHFREVFGY